MKVAVLFYNYVFDFCRTLVNARDDEQLTALHWAVIANFPEHVRLLLANQADPAVGDADQRSPLHYCVSRGSMECLKIILHMRPDAVNVADGSGRTCLHVACGEGRYPLFGTEYFVTILAWSRLLSCWELRGCM